METESLVGNYEGRCGEGFWLWPRRRVPSIPAAGCDDRGNAGHGQRTRRPEGFRGKGRLASPCSRMLSALLRGGRAQRLLRRASPSGLFPENSPPRSFQTGSNAGLAALVRRAPAGALVTPVLLLARPPPAHGSPLPDGGRRPTG